MLRGKHGVVLLCGTVVVLVLSACATPAPAVTASALRTVSPSSAAESDAEAFASAVQLYRAYLNINDLSLHRVTGAQAELKQYLSAAAWLRDESSKKRFFENGGKLTGFTSLGRVEEQNVSASKEWVSFYACENFSAVRIYNRTGTEVSPTHRAVQQTFLVKVQGLPALPVEISSEQWTGASVC